MSGNIRTYSTAVVESKQRNEAYDIPPFSYPEEPGVVISSRWSPEKPLRIWAVEISCSISYGAAEFLVLRGFNNKTVDLENAYDVLRLGGEVMQPYLAMPAGKTQHMIYVGTWTLSPSEWIAVGHYNVTCNVMSPSIRFYSELLQG